MSCAYAKYTGKIGVCVATSGPGAIHLLNGLYDAKADNVPVIAITGSTFSDLMNSRFSSGCKPITTFLRCCLIQYNDKCARASRDGSRYCMQNCLARKGVGHINIP